MPKISLQLKNILSVASSALIGLFAGIAGNRWDSNAGPWDWPASLAALLLLFQIALLVFIESKEEEELTQQRKGRMASELQDQQLYEKAANAMMKALDEGRMKDFNEIKRIRDEFLR